MATVMKRTVASEITAGERLNRLVERIESGLISRNEILCELRWLRLHNDSAYFRQKINGAIDWCNVYFSAPKSKRYAGGRDQVRALFLRDLRTAARITGRDCSTRIRPSMT